MNNMIRKLTSRKFLLAVVGIMSGLALSMGVDGSELIDMIGKIAGIVTAVASAITYINAEAKVDAAAVKRDE